MKRFFLIFTLLYFTLKASAVSYLINNVYFGVFNETRKWAQVFGSIDNSATSVTLPSSVVIGGQTYKVVKIGDYAFQDHINLKTVFIPNTVYFIGKSAFRFSGVTALDIPNSVGRIEDLAFANMSSLGSINLSNEINNIPFAAFINSSLRSIVIPNSVVAIKERAFGSASDLEAITIPRSMENIENYAMMDCSSLSTIYLRNTDPSTIKLGTIGTPVGMAQNFLKNCYDYTIYVPPGSKVCYEASPQWKGLNLAEEGSNALHFDGVDDNVSLPLNPIELGTFTIEMWIKPNSIPATGFAALLNTDAWDETYYGHSVHFQFSDSKLSLAVHGVTGGFPTANYTPTLNVWQHIAVTYDAYAHKVNFYVNGNLVTTVTNNSLPFARMDAASLGSWLGTQRFFNGAIDEVRIWRTVRTEQEIKDNMNVSFENTASVYSPQYINDNTLMRNYKFNHGLAAQNNNYATVLTNYSWGKDGTLKNFALSGSTSNFVKGVDFPILNVSTRNDTIAAASKSATTINVSANVDWNVASDQNWLTVDKASSTGKGTFTLTATANTATDPRTATVTVTATGCATKTITITQRADIINSIEKNSGSPISISPNPATNKFVVKGLEHATLLQLFNSKGTSLFEKMVDNGAIISVSNLPKGVYIIKLGEKRMKLIKE